MARKISPGAEVSHVQSHFVFPRPDEIWLDGETPTWHKGTAAKPAETPMPGLRLMVRYGSAAVGVFLPLTKERAKFCQWKNSWTTEMRGIVSA